MDWSNEIYVKVYVRETDDDLALSWDALSLWRALLLKFDRAGLVQTKRGARGLAAIVRMPAERASDALSELLEDGRLVEVEGGFCAPNFMAAQEAIKSDKLRARESRERARGKKLADRPGRSSESSSGEVAHETITKRDAPETNRDETVTRGHAASRAVTLSSADLSLAERSVAPARTRDPEIQAAPSPDAIARRGRAARFAEELWMALGGAHARLRGEGVDPGAPALGGLPGPESKGWKLAVERATELLDQHELAEARAIGKHRLDYAIAEARAGDPPSLRYFAPPSYFAQGSWEIATSRSLESVHAQPARGPRNAREEREQTIRVVRDIGD